MIPMKQTPLSQLAFVSAGQGAPKDNEFSESGVPFVRAGSLEALLAGKNESELELVSTETAKLRKLKIYPKGTILFAKSGMSATKDRVYVLQNPAHVVSHLATLIPKDGAHVDYLRLALKRFSPSSLIKDPAYPAIGLGEIENFEIPVPEEFEDQIRITHLLGKVEGLIGQRKQHLQQLDDLLKSVFLEMFGPTNPNHANWPLVEIRDLAAKHKGAMRTGPFGSNLLHSEFTPEGDVAVLGIDNAVQNQFVWGELSDGEHQLLHSLGLCLLFRTTNCLFLLDEPETHFNPDWRANFISQLRQCLPGNGNVGQEMLITTHTPFLISDSKPDKVLIFKKDKTSGAVSISQPDYNTLGASINKITMSTFGKRETIGGHAQALLEALRARFEHGEESEKELIAEIQRELGDSVEKVLLINAILDRLERKGRAEQG